MYKLSVRKGTLALTVLLASTGIAAGLEGTIVLGGDDGFAAFSRIENLRVIADGRGDSADLVLADSQTDPRSPELDLYLDFDRLPLGDRTMGYGVTMATAALSQVERARGTASAAFQFKEGRIELSPGAGTLFGGRVGSTAVWSDFSIGFWLYPTALDEGESVLQWSGVRGADAGALYTQELGFSILGRRAVWKLERVFVDPGGSAMSVRLEGRRPLIPRMWVHHQLRFDSQTGLVEYLVDGVPEAIAYATASGREDGRPLTPKLGVGRPVVIGEGYSGLLDELVIRRDSGRPDLARFHLAGGYAETDIIDTGTANSLIRRIDAKVDVPPTASAFFYYWVGNQWQPQPEADPWTPFVPGRPLANVRGRFVRLRVELFPDGRQGAGPTLSELLISYEPNPPPPPPSRLTAEPGDERVTLRWAPVPDPDVRGYRVYYGNRPGVYNGTDADIGPSPVIVRNANSVVLEGLENGLPYFFVVSAFDDNDDPLVSPLSAEVSARPSRIYR